MCVCVYRVGVVFVVLSVVGFCVVFVVLVVEVSSCCVQRLLHLWVAGGWGCWEIIALCCLHLK